MITKEITSEIIEMGNDFENDVSFTDDVGLLNFLNNGEYVELTNSKWRIQITKVSPDRECLPQSTDCADGEHLCKILIDGHNSAVRTLHKLKRNSSCNLKMEMHLFFSASSGDLDGTKSVIDAGARIDAADYNGRTALHLAADRGHVHIVEYLIAQGASLECKDRSGDTPLDLATKAYHRDVQLCLRNAGAQPHRKDSLDDIKEKRSNLARFAVMEAFPRPIAMALLDGRRIEPTSRDEVSLCFSDIVGFTAMSSTMPPAKVSDMLGRLFAKFDRLAYLHGVQTIDVVGDAYIAATNFTEAQPFDHAARLARFAAAAVRAAADTPVDEADPDGRGWVSIRVGIHCGPVAGSVVGTQRVKYTLMGDAVNTASRMESTALPGRIQCSAAAAALISVQAHEMILTPRHGGVNVKGKGHMVTYWVTSCRKALRRTGSCPDFTNLARRGNRKASLHLDPVDTLDPAVPAAPPPAAGGQVPEVDAPAARPAQVRPAARRGTVVGGGVGDRCLAADGFLAEAAAVGSLPATTPMRTRRPTGATGVACTDPAAGPAGAAEVMPAADKGAPSESQHAAGAQGVSGRPSAEGTDSVCCQWRQGMLRMQSQIFRL